MNAKLMKHIILIAILSLSSAAAFAGDGEVECSAIGGESGTANAHVNITNNTGHNLIVELFADYRERASTKKYNGRFGYDYNHSYFSLGDQGAWEDNRVYTKTLASSGGSVRALGTIPTCGYGSPAGMGFRILGLDGTAVYVQTGGADNHPAIYQDNHALVNPITIAPSCDGGGGIKMFVVVPKPDSGKSYKSCGSGATQAGPLCISYSQGEHSCWKEDVTYNITVQKQVDDATLNNFRTQMN